MDSDYSYLEDNYRDHLRSLWDTLIAPVSMTKDKNIFLDWMEMKQIWELKESLRVFESLEMYEECQLIVDHLETREC